MFWSIARGMKRSAFVKLLGRGSGVTSSSWRLNFVVAIFLLDQMSGRRRDMRRGLPSCGVWSTVEALQPRAVFLVLDTAITS